MSASDADLKLAHEVLEAIGFDLHLPNDNPMHSDFRRVVEHRDRCTRKLAGIIARVRRVERAIVTEQDRVFATRMCEAFGVKAEPDRVKEVSKILSDQREVLLSCATVRMERIFEVVERSGDSPYGPAETEQEPGHRQLKKQRKAGKSV